MIKRDFAYYTLVLAGIYNFLWGAWVIFFPELSFTVLGAEPPKYLEIWQCVGMIVGVYGLGYIIAAFNPLKHWPIVLVGFLGKVFGPIGFAYALIQGIFPLSFGLNIIFNDLIWWIPFFLILKKALYFKTEKAKVFSQDDLNNMDHRFRVKLINSLVGPKPVNLIGSIDQEQNTNLAIISSVVHLGANPALVGFINRPDSVERHTLENIKSTGYFTINQVHKNIIQQSHQTSARYPKKISEFKACNLQAEFQENFIAPFVAESKVKLGVRFLREIKLEENGVHLIIGQIEKIILPENSILSDGHLNQNLLAPIAATGLDEYFDISSLGRLSYAKPDKALKIF
ncbi:MAG: flavin reductase [Bacteriovoracaceae bacterium]